MKEEKSIEKSKKYEEKEVFESLNPVVAKWFKQKFGGFTESQKHAVIPIKHRKNILVSSPTGSGKCITPKTTILIEDNKKTRLVNGEELIKRAKEKEILKKIENGRLVDIPNIRSFSLSNNKTTKQKALVYYEKYKGKIYKIKTEGGREIELSPNHPLLVEKEEGYNWIPVKDIKEGEKIAVASKIDLPEKEIFLDYRGAIKNLRKKSSFVIDYNDFLRLKSKSRGFSEFYSLTNKELYEIKTLLRLSFSDLCKELNLKSTASSFNLFNSHINKERLYELFRDKSKNLKFEESRIIVKNRGNQTFSFTYPKMVDIKLARWLAFVLAEGIIGDYKPGTFLMISQKRRIGLLKEFLNTTKEVFDLEFVKRNEKDYALYSTVFCQFITFLLEIKMGRGRNVSLPDWILDAKKDIKSNFLMVFFSLEATIPKDGKEIVLSQSNQNKIEIINYLLLSFGIFSALSKKIRYATNTKEKTKRLYYYLIIRQIKNLKLFLNNINIEHQERGALEKRILGKTSGNYFGKYKFGYKKISVLSRLYPNYKSFLKELESIYEVNRRTGYICESALIKLKKVVLNLKKKKETQALINEIDKLLNSDISWLKIKKIEIEDYNGELVDLSVPNIHNFIGGYGGIWLHNTLCAFASVLDYLISLSERKELENKVYAVYCSPLKALANDVEINLKNPLKEMEKLAGREFGIRVSIRTGDTPTSERQKMIKQCPHILICTPETLSIVLTTRKFVEHLKGVEFLIIDEIHALANKRGVYLSLSVEMLEEISILPIARIGLSATVAPLDEIANFLVGEGNEEDKRECLVADVQFTKKTDIQVLTPVSDLIDTTGEELHGNLYDLLDKLIQEHKTTLIFTNTRSATERVVHHLKDRFPSRYLEDIGAHHSSLSKRHRFDIEQRLREGKLKVVVTSTSLELGIDIGYIDLVILLGSPKSAARLLQRSGRSGHKLHEISKCRLIAMDRDDLVECCVLAKEAVERKIDKIQIPKNCLDVLAQQIYGMAIYKIWEEDEMFSLIKKSYCYKNLSREDFLSVLSYLSGEYELEARNVYAKIWYDKESRQIGKRGKLARMIYMTNIGTIPEESFMDVVISSGERKDEKVGVVDEAFLERIKPRDVFVLGGNKYMFLYARGMKAYVAASVQRPPTIPSWFSEMLPLSFDSALEISRFRKLIDEMLKAKKSAREIKEFIARFVYCTEATASAIYSYFNEQFKFARIPNEKRLLIEFYSGEKNYVIFHSLFGRKVNDALSRALAYLVAQAGGRDVEIGINDNGFFLAGEKMQVEKALKFLNSKNLREVLEAAIERTEILQRRFRHCATRALMILRSYKGRRKTVGRQQMSSFFLLSTINKLTKNFPIVREAKREVLEDVMDIKNAGLVLDWLKEGKVKTEIIYTKLPSPFALNLIMQGYSDLLKIEDKIAFLKRMHEAHLKEIVER